MSLLRWHCTGILLWYLCNVCLIYELVVYSWGDLCQTPGISIRIPPAQIRWIYILRRGWSLYRSLNSFSGPFGLVWGWGSTCPARYAWNSRFIGSHFCLHDEGKTMSMWPDDSFHLSQDCSADRMEITSWRSDERARLIDRAYVSSESELDVVWNRNFNLAYMMMHAEQTICSDRSYYVAVASLFLA